IQEFQISQQVEAQAAIASPAQVEQLLGQYRQTSLLLLDEQHLSQLIIEQHPSIADVYITKQFPSTLIIEYIPQIALAQLISPQSKFLVNRQGYIFSEQQLGNLPQIITSNHQMKVGLTISAQGLNLDLKLIEDLRQTTSSIKTITLTDQQLELVLDNPPRILV